MSSFNYSALLFIAAFILCAYEGFCQQLTYSAGYHEVKFTDSARRYQPSARVGDPLFYRPVQLDIWFPVIKKLDEKTLDYSFFLSLFERRANSFQNDAKYDSLATELLRHFTIGNGKLPAPLSTHSLLNAAPASGRFPVIVYLCSYNGMSYENIPLFEKLAEAGYYVVTISSIGRYPGNMTTQYPDVLEQTKDALFAISHIRDPAADLMRIGVIGYSFGGLSGIQITQGRSAVRCFLSLDGSEKHYYGRDKQEDRDFDTCRRYIFLNSKVLPNYAYLESDHKNENGEVDSVFTPMTNRDRTYSRIVGAEHEDFSCVSGLGSNQTKAYQEILKLTVSYFGQTLNGKKQLFDQQLNLLATAHKALKLPENTSHSFHGLTLSGKIVDADKKDAVPYASIGIPSGNLGTVSNADGRFTLEVADTLNSKIIRISSIGYRPLLLPVSDLAAIIASHEVIALKKDIRELPTVIISAAKPVYKVIGNTSRSKFFSVGFPFRDLGSEVGIIISLGKQKVLVQSFNYHISYTHMDSCTFRLNIYAVRNGSPAENLLLKNIITGVGERPGDYTIDLKPYLIELSGDVCASLEWIGGTTAVQHGNVFFLGGLLASSYHRKTAQAAWVKFKGLGAAFNLKVEKL